ncbi:MFS transporter, partial [Nocardia sp. NPDC057353]|uniref:MFS transporter n=1 Tax=Nocardia sp. NPDC057353 TaxID=3346104 RepID=UPI00362C7B26
CHGAFFGIGSVVAARLVDRDKRASAIAVMFAGLTLANVLGVPLGTLVGQQFGWRSTFWAITAIGVAAMVGIAALVPAIGRDADSDLRREFLAFTHPQVWLSMAITVLGFGGVFGAFTFIAYTLTEVGGFASSTVPWLLVLFGLGSLLGNLLGAKAADRALTPTLAGVLGILTVVLLGFALSAQNQPAVVVALFLMGTFGFATVPGLQMRIMNYAPGAPTLASGANIAAFNVGNAIGAWLGGLTIAAGLGFTAPLWAGAAVTAAGLLVLLGAAALERSRTPDRVAAARIPVGTRG